MVLKSLFSSSPVKTNAHRLYVAIVARARRAEFYRIAGVADTPTGRFDMICAHMAIVLARISARADQRSGEFAQALYDAMFTDMDRALREMGVGDLSVGKRVRKMAESFHNQASAYRDALVLQGAARVERLADLAGRFLVPEAPAGSAAARQLGDYLDRFAAAIDDDALSRLTTGEPVWDENEALEFC